VLAAALDDKDPLGDVRREVFAALGPGQPVLPDVARRLGVSERTLQRRLSERETTFTDVVDDTRRAIAEDHLRRDKLSVGEIAFLLGYSEPSAFSRAFHRWTGAWPADFRARARLA
jgi:AraC-like DNA-binding protein